MNPKPELSEEEIKEVTADPALMELLKVHDNISKAFGEMLDIVLRLSREVDSLKGDKDD